jgi:hypothetical protein
MKRPRLHPDDLDNESRVLGAVDALLLSSVNYKLMSARILEAQDKLQAASEIDAWIAYLDIEQLVNERVNFMLMTAIKFAFHEGRRHQRHRRGGR